MAWEDASHPQKKLCRHEPEDLLGEGDQDHCMHRGNPAAVLYGDLFYRRKKMKRFLKPVSLFLVLIMVMAMLLAGCGAAKDTDPANAAYVTLSVEAELGQAKDNSYVAATAIEIPAEGTTVGEVIKALHVNCYADGESGYATAAGQYGDMIVKLWGIENGGAYGYYINGNMAMGLTDPVVPGDRVDVFVYKDAAAYSDAFIYMTAEASGTNVTVSVKAMGYDANWSPVWTELEGTKIYYIKDGKLTDTGAVTDAAGTATFTLKNGIYRIVGINTNAIYTVTAQKLVVSK